MQIRTNNQWRDVLTWDELTPKQQKLVEDFDHTSSFIPYKGWVYSLEEFTRTDIPGWQGLCPDSFSSGVVIRLSSDGERAILGTAIC